MKLSRPARLSFGFLLVPSLFLAGAGCKRDPGEVREWTAADHDNQEKPEDSGQVDPEKRAAMPSLAEHGIDDVVLATWKQNCIPCHGVIGRGDGPNGAVFHPPNFTEPEWQRVHLDEEMARAIQKGKGKMPAFSQIPPETVQGLVRLVRLLNPERHEAPDSNSKSTGSP